MLLPNYQQATIDLQKLRNYVLNENHPVGKYKAKVFKAVLFITSEDAELLRTKILEKLSLSEAMEKSSDNYGKRYTVDLIIRNLDREAVVRTAWIILKQESTPKLITCYILK
jgi:hypothetical protein